MAVINVFIFIGIIAAGISGALVGIKKQLDLFGIVCLAVATALGGGIVRDLLIGNVPPGAFKDPSYFIASVIAALFTWIFYHKTDKLKNIIMVSDAIGLGVFTAIGANTALTHDMGEPFIVVSMGLITGIGGGVLRDIFSKEIPFVFRKEIYAIASILGSISLYMTYDQVPYIISLYICLVVTFVVRVVSVIFNFNFPVFKTKMGAATEKLSNNIKDPA
jgi:uncharacterized membrane protein YeiH